MRFLFVLLFPSLLFAAKTVKTTLPEWTCDGTVHGFDELDSEIADRWKKLKTFKFEGPFENTNMAYADVMVEKHEFHFIFVYNALGRSSMFDETMQSEGVSLDVGIAGKSYGGSSFQVMDGATLPKIIGLRVDLEQDKKNYIVRLICKKGKK
ncbi:MAG: hypothetical protein H7235_05995 [Bdellovibrionaceae bacterium]|nr:hypothetical protein [Pseudobdellovibrionaceae bacterium]